MTRCALFALVVCAAPLAAQRGGRPQTCNVHFESTTDSTHSKTLETATKKHMTWMGGGIRVSCIGTQMVMFADSVEHFEDASLLNMYGHVRYREAGPGKQDTTKIDANTMRYAITDQRIVAEGNVTARSRTGSTLRAPLVTYLRPLPPTRNYTVLDAVQRAFVVMSDSAKMPDSLKTNIEADHIHVERDTLYNAGGRVVITRPDLTTNSDSAVADIGKHSARLLGGSPRVFGAGAHPFSVEGKQIDVFGRVKEVDSVYAHGRAQAKSDSLTMTADTLHMLMSKSLIDRVLAWGGRSHAVSTDRDIVANRIDITMPGQKMHELTAIGAARAETKADSAIKSTERNWIEGDTLHALFEPRAPADSNKQPVIRTIFSIGNARSFYQLQPREQKDTLPTLNYVVGRRIDVAFLAGDVRNVHVTGEVRGINLQQGAPDTTSGKKPAPARGRGGSGGRGGRGGRGGGE